VLELHALFVDANSSTTNGSFQQFNQKLSGAKVPAQKAARRLCTVEAAEAISHLPRCSSSKQRELWRNWREPAKGAGEGSP